MNNIRITNGPATCRDCRHGAHEECHAMACDCTHPICTKEAYSTPYGWFASPKGAQISCIPCDGRGDAIDTAFRLRNS